MPLLLRVVRMTFASAHVPAFLALFRASAARIRQQPGCRHLELWRDATDPHTYCTFSHWETTEALAAYRRSTLFGEVWPATKRLFSAPPLAFSSQLLADEGTAEADAVQPAAAQ